MNPKISKNKVTDLTDALMNIIDSTESKVSYRLRKAFYFKGRKSDSIAKEVIKHLTEKDDVILDPFFGGGSFIIAALEAGRYIQGIELDSYTYDIVSTILTKVDHKKVQEEYNLIKDDIKHEVMDLYRTKCCGERNYIQKLHFDPEEEEYYHPKVHRDIKNGENIVLINRCSICGKKSKKFDDYDKKILEESKLFDNSDFPKSSYIENSRINITRSTGADRYDRIFSDRNQQALLKIQEKISSLKESKEKRFIQHALVTSLALSKITLYGSSTDNFYHVLNQGAQDMNVWYLFNSRLKSMIKFQEEYSEFLVRDVTNNNQMHLQNNSYKNVLKSQNDVVDLIYTDFPYTDQVPYLERHQIFRVWLEKFYDSKKFKLTDEMLKEEIVISNAPSRREKGTMQRYYQDIDRMFGLFYKVLKENKYVVLTMNLGAKKYIETYSEVINLARKNGFEFVTKADIQKNNPTLIKQSAYANTFMDEAIVIFQKLSEDNRYWYEGDLNYEFIATKVVYEHIRRQDIGRVTLPEAMSLIGNDLLSRGIAETTDTRELSEQTIKNNFVIKDGFVYIDSSKLYLGIEDETTLSLKLYDLIPIYIKDLLKKQGKFVLEDLYLELVNTLFLSNPNNLSQLLESKTYQNEIGMLIDNYCDVEDGYYVAKKVDNEAQKDRQDISQFNGTEFEILIKKLLEKEGYFNAVINGGSGDRGVDITASIMIEGQRERHIFQCKRWISNVGSQPIQRLFAEREYHKYDRALCVTTSDFTQEGDDALKRFEVEGWTGLDVQKKLNKYFPDQYYNTTLNIES